MADAKSGDNTNSFDADQLKCSTMPTVSFTTNYSTILVGSSVQFTGTVIGGIPAFTFTWNFGDGLSGSTQINATHKYLTPGTFAVSFAVKDSDDHVATATGVIYCLSQSNVSIASLALTPMAAPGPYVGGTSFMLTVTYRNTGDTSATVDATMDDGAYTGLNWNDPTAVMVNPSSSNSQAFSVTVTAGATTNASVDIHVTWNGTEAISGRVIFSASPIDQILVAIQARANVAITNLAVTPAGPYVGGTSFTLTVTYGNTGGTAATVDATMDDGAYTGLNWNDPTAVTVNPSSSNSQAFSVTVTAGATTNASVDIHVTWSGNEAITNRAISGDMLIDQILVAIQSQAVVAITNLAVTPAGPYVGGTSFTLTVTYGNTGGTAGTVTAACTAGTYVGLTFVVPAAVSVPAGGANTQLVTVNIAAGAGTNASVDIHVTWSGTEAISGRAISGDMLIDQILVAIQSQAVVAITNLAVTPASPFVAGMNFTLTVTFSNTGGTAATVDAAPEVQSYGYIFISNPASIVVNANGTASQVFLCIIASDATPDTSVDIHVTWTGTEAISARALTGDTPVHAVTGDLTGTPQNQFFIYIGAAMFGVFAVMGILTSSSLGERRRIKIVRKVIDKLGASTTLPAESLEVENRKKKLANLRYQLNLLEEQRSKDILELRKTCAVEQDRIKAIHFQKNQEAQGQYQRELTELQAIQGNVEAEIDQATKLNKDLSELHQKRQDVQRKISEMKELHEQHLKELEEIELQEEVIWSAESCEKKQEIEAYWNGKINALEREKIEQEQSLEAQLAMEAERRIQLQRKDSLFNKKKELMDKLQARDDKILDEVETQVNKIQAQVQGFRANGFLPSSLGAKSEELHAALTSAKTSIATQRESEKKSEQFVNTLANVDRQLHGLTSKVELQRAAPVLYLPAIEKKKERVKVVREMEFLCELCHKPVSAVEMRDMRSWVKFMVTGVKFILNINDADIVRARRKEIEDLRARVSDNFMDTTNRQYQAQIDLLREVLPENEERLDDELKALAQEIMAGESAGKQKDTSLSERMGNYALFFERIVKKTFSTKEIFALISQKEAMLMQLVSRNEQELIRQFLKKSGKMSIYTSILQLRHGLYVCPECKEWIDLMEYTADENGGKNVE
nr:PKD domain-containing protein [Candidatus Sigynarchaeota archaeon]